MDARDPALLSAPSPKRAVVALSHALERSLQAPSADDPPGLLLACFQAREYFDVERSRYANLARAGHTVVVTFAGPSADMPAGVHVVATQPDDPRVADWSLITVRGGYASGLVARSLHVLSADELSLEASKSFDTAWTFRRSVALSEGRRMLDSLAPDLHPAVVDAVRAHLDRCADFPVSPGEARLAAAADHLVRSIDRSHRRTAEVRADRRRAEDQSD